MEKMMEILVFGQLEDVTGSTVLSIESVADTELLLQSLYARFPSLQQKKIRIAINKKIVHGKMALEENDSIALLPPFSGG